MCSSNEPATAGAPYDVVLSGARIDGTLDAEGDFKLERLMAAARPLGNRALPTQSLPPPTAASGAYWALSRLSVSMFVSAGWSQGSMSPLRCTIPYSRCHYYGYDGMGDCTMSVALDEASIASATGFIGDCAPHVKDPAVPQASPRR